MSISTSSNPVTSHVSPLTNTPSTSFAASCKVEGEQPASDEEERDVNQIVIKKEKIEQEHKQPDQQVKRRKEDEGIEGFKTDIATSATKSHQTLDSTLNIKPKLVPSIVCLNPIETQGNLRQPFIVTGHIVEHKPAHPMIKNAGSFSTQSTHKSNSTTSNSSTNIVVKNNSNNNLSKLSGNHVVKLDTTSNILSKTNSISSSGTAKKAPASRPDLVASSISALHSGHYQSQAKSRPLLINHNQHLLPNIVHTNSSYQQSGSANQADNKQNKFDPSKAIATTLSSQFILSSFITANAGVKTQQLANGSNLNGMQFCLNTAPQSTNVTLANFASSSSADLTTGSSSSTNASKPATSSVIVSKVASVSSPSGNTKNKCSKPSSVESSQSLDQSASSSVSPNGSVNLASARLLDLGKRLIEATKSGNLGLVRELVVDSGAPFTTDWLDTSALHIAAQNGFLEIAEILVQGGINKDARTKLGRTALHLAAQNGSAEVADLLIRSGCEINCRDMLKMTPLHWAVERRQIAIVKRLLLANADYRIKNKFQLTPLNIAKNSGSFDIIELFKNWTSGENTTDEKSNAYKNLEAVLNESQDFLDIDYHLALVDSATSSQDHAVLEKDEPCLDLVGFEWNKFDFAPELFLPNTNEDEQSVGYLMKIVEELQKENQQLRQRVEQLSTTDR